MKTTELLNILTEEELLDYFTRLKKKEKIKKLGDGQYAHVFQHPMYHNVAVKVFDPEEDHAYLHYLKWARRNQKNKYVPKIITVRTINQPETEDEYGDGAITIVFMQKLRPAPVRAIRQLIAQCMTYAEAADERGHYTADWQDMHKVGDFTAFDSDVWWHVAEGARKGTVSQPVDRDLASLAAFFAEEDPEDIHNGNIMMTDDGQLVFTDPLSP